MYVEAGCITHLGQPHNLGGEMTIVVGRKGATVIWNAEKRMDAAQLLIWWFLFLADATRTRQRGA